MQYNNHQTFHVIEDRFQNNASAMHYIVFEQLNL